MHMKRETESTATRRTLVILPLTLPGCGKTAIISMAQGHLMAECATTILSSEDIRYELLKKYKTMPREFAQRKIAKEYNVQFAEKLGTGNR